MKNKFKEFCFEDLIDEIKAGFKNVLEEDCTLIEEEIDDKAMEDKDKMYADTFRAKYMLYCVNELRKEMNDFLVNYNKNKENEANRKKIELFK